jgi:hypothetical protein
MIEEADVRETPQVYVVLNRFEALERLVPTI